MVHFVRWPDRTLQGHQIKNFSLSHCLWGDISWGRVQYQVDQSDTLLYRTDGPCICTGRSASVDIFRKMQDKKYPQDIINFPINYPRY